METMSYMVRPGINKVNIFKNNSFKKNNKISLKTIAVIVCNYLNTSMIEVNKNHRKGIGLKARQICHFFAKELTTDISLDEIGFFFGGKDHATVLHSIKKVNNIYDTEKKYRQEIDELKEKFNNLI